MSDIFSKVLGGADTSKLTPIEIALEIDGNGMATAKKLYDFLELNPGNYARWCKNNITENPFAEEGKDYHSSTMKSEGKGNFADDFKLTASFAKKLSMMQKNQKGEAARNYFVGVEDGAKKIIMSNQTSYYVEAATLRGLANLGNLVRNTMKDKKAKPHEVAIVLDSLFKQSGLSLPEVFIKAPEYEQLEMNDFMNSAKEGL